MWLWLSLAFQDPSRGEGVQRLTIAYLPMLKLDRPQFYVVLIPRFLQQATLL